MRAERRPVRHGDHVAINPAGEPDRAAHRHDVTRHMPGDRHRPVDHDHVTGGLPGRHDRAARDDHVIGRGGRGAGPEQEHQQRGDH